MTTSASIGPPADEPSRSTAEVSHSAHPAVMTTIAKTRHIDVRALLDVRAVFRAGRRV
jgi:hypothetical protein